jgi:hypothetical protein
MSCMHLQTASVYVSIQDNIGKLPNIEYNLIKIKGTISIELNKLYNNPTFKSTNLKCVGNHVGIYNIRANK